MNKKLAMALVIAGMLLTGCAAAGSTAAETTTAEEIKESEELTLAETVAKTEEEPVTEQEKSEDDPLVARMEALKRHKTITITTQDGYQIRSTFTYSPLISCENWPAVEAAWKVFDSGEGELPTVDSWGLEPGPYGVTVDMSLYDNTSGYPSGKKPTWKTPYGENMYYVLGTIYFENITPGFSLSKEKPLTSINTSISFGHLSYYGGTLAKVFFSKPETVANKDNLNLYPNLTSDIWGPVTIVFAIPDDRTPNAPDGALMEHIKEEGLTVNLYPKAGWGVGDNGRCSCALDIYNDDPVEERPEYKDNLYFGKPYTKDEFYALTADEKRAVMSSYRGKALSEIRDVLGEEGEEDDELKAIKFESIPFSLRFDSNKDSCYEIILDIGEGSEIPLKEAVNRLGMPLTCEATYRARTYYENGYIFVDFKKYDKSNVENTITGGKAYYEFEYVNTEGYTSTEPVVEPD